MRIYENCWRGGKKEWRLAIRVVPVREDALNDEAISEENETRNWSAMSGSIVF